jgi:hypothetical protein
MKSLIIIALALNLYAGWGYEGYAKNSLRDRLKDAESAKFKELDMFNGRIICGKVNAKNSYGGYSGYQMFIGNGTIGFLESDMKYSEWVKVWNQTCK